MNTFCLKQNFVILYIQLLVIIVLLQVKAKNLLFENLSKQMSNKVKWVDSIKIIRIKS